MKCGREMFSRCVQLLTLVQLYSLVESRTCVCGATWEGGNVNIRSCASTSCSILGSLAPGDCLDYLTTSGTWFAVDLGQTAYVHSDYLSGPQYCGGGSTGLCTARLCSSFSTNERRGCDSYGCGNYGASRTDRPHLGWDVPCNAGDVVSAPFNGTVTRRAYPYGDGSCCDTGFEIIGSGEWAGHRVLMFYSDPNLIPLPSEVTIGQPVATHVGLHCGCYGTGMTDHTHYQVDYNDERIDPASFLFC